MFTITGLAAADPLPPRFTARADDIEFPVRLRVDTPLEESNLRHGGILAYVLRRLATP